MKGKTCPACLCSTLFYRMVDVDGTNLIEMLECSNCGNQEYSPTETK